ncbi:MAG: SRPBCC family protein [Proteobacteria bacterium]|nr:SRPBCC family protein [Pseudomonadota bacterium]
MTTSTDRIERKIVIKATRARVWRALTHIEEFNSWFGVRLKGREFAAGELFSGNVTYPGYEHITMEVTIQRCEPEKMLSWRWHPHAVDPHKDYSSEPTSLVEFRLEDAADGTLLTVVESGFDQIPPERRLTAFRGNSEGWDIQVQNINKYVTAS